MPSIGQQLLWLFILALPVASITWTITHEEISREFREWCRRRSERARGLLARKLYYALTCEYCLSHYVAAGVVAATSYRLLMPGWRGYVIAFFALTAVANCYMSLFGRLRVDIRSERLDIEAKEQQVGASDDEKRL